MPASVIVQCKTRVVFTTLMRRTLAAPLLVSALGTTLVKLADAQDDDDPFCGRSRRDLKSDPVRRMCLRQCRLDDNGLFRPTFTEWEDYCRETAAMDDWDVECEDYLCCTFGCDVYGGNRDVCKNAQGEERYSLLLDTKENTYAAGITQEERCDLEKCHSYCARVSFHTCRELQWNQTCEASQPLLYGCDVKCNSSKPMEWSFTCLFLVILTAHLEV